jgi:XRE family transcriptional regulator, regulator of sulfur utilization
VGESPDPQVGFGMAVRKIRTDADLIQSELAQRSEIHPSQISEIENGKGNPRWASARRIAAALGIELAELAAQAEFFEERLQDGSAKGRAGFEAIPAPRQRRGRAERRDRRP